MQPLAGRLDEHWVALWAVVSDFPTAELKEHCWELMWAQQFGLQLYLWAVLLGARWGPQLAPQKGPPTAYELAQQMACRRVVLMDFRSDGRTGLRSDMLRVYWRVHMTEHSWVRNSASLWVARLGSQTGTLSDRQ